MLAEAGGSIFSCDFLSEPSLNIYSSARSLQIASIIYASVLTSIVCSKLTLDQINIQGINDLNQAR